ncbi:MAG: indole-3-glycerol phosphate synthase [Bradymonadia bacterium]
MIGTVLEGIVAQTKKDVARREESRPLSAFDAALMPSQRDFRSALVAGRDNTVEGWPALISEFKPKSPSRGPIRPGALPSDIVPTYENYASAVSVLCDGPYFGGGYPVLAEARAHTERPIIAKDFVVCEYQIAEAREAGADAILLMATVLDDDDLERLEAYARGLQMNALVEVHDREELTRVLDHGYDIIGVNSRDLKTLKIHRAHMCELLALVPPGAVRVAESGVDTFDDVSRVVGLADAVLIGSTLMAVESPAAKIEELGWRRA